MTKVQASVPVHDACCCALSSDFDFHITDLGYVVESFYFFCPWKLYLYRRAMSMISKPLSVQSPLTSSVLVTTGISPMTILNIFSPAGLDLKY